MEEGDVVTISLKDVPDEPNMQYFKPHSGEVSNLGLDQCQCPLCVIPVKITYKDVLILEQFMRKDGTVLPREFTGL